MAECNKDYGAVDILVLLSRLSALEDEYLSAVSSDPLRGGKQIPAIYLYPLEIMSQQAQSTQSFIGAHGQHWKINK